MCQWQEVSTCSCTSSNEVYLCGLLIFSVLLPIITSSSHVTPPRSNMNSFSSAQLQHKLFPEKKGEWGAKKLTTVFSLYSPLWILSHHFSFFLSPVLFFVPIIESGSLSQVISCATLLTSTSDNPFKTATKTSVLVCCPRIKYSA